MTKQSSRSRSNPASVPNSTRNSVASSRALSAISSLSSLPRGFVDDGGPASPEFDFAALRAASRTAPTPQDPASPPYSIAALSDDEDFGKLDTRYRDEDQGHPPQHTSYPSSSKGTTGPREASRHTQSSRSPRTEPLSRSYNSNVNGTSYNSSANFDPPTNNNANGLSTYSSRSTSGTKSPASSLTPSKRKPATRNKLHLSSHSNSSRDAQGESSTASRQPSGSYLAGKSSPSSATYSSLGSSVAAAQKPSRSSVHSDRYHRSLRATRSSVDLTPSTSPDPKHSYSNASVYKSPGSPYNHKQQLSYRAESAFAPITVTSEIVAGVSSSAPSAFHPSSRAPQSSSQHLSAGKRLKTHKSLGSMPAPVNGSSGQNGRMAGPSHSFNPDAPSSSSNPYGGMMRRKSAAGIEIDVSAANNSSMPGGAASLPQSPRVRSSASTNLRPMNNKRSTQGLRSMSSTATGIKSSTAGRMSERARPSPRIGDLTWATDDTGPFGAGDVELSRRTDRFASVDLGPFGGGSEEEEDEEDDASTRLARAVLRPSVRKPGMGLDDSEEEEEEDEEDEDEDEDDEDDFDPDDDDAFTRRHKFGAPVSAVKRTRGIGIGTVGLGAGLGLGMPPKTSAAAVAKKLVPETTKSTERSVSSSKAPKVSKAGVSSRSVSEEVSTGGRWSEGFDLNAAIAELLNEDRERRRERRRRRAAARDRRRRREAGENVSEPGSDEEDLDLDDDDDGDEDEELDVDLNTGDDAEALERRMDELAVSVSTGKGVKSSSKASAAAAVSDMRLASDPTHGVQQKDRSRTAGASTPGSVAELGRGASSQQQTQTPLGSGKSRQQQQPASSSSAAYTGATPSSKGGSRRTPVLHVPDGDAPEWEQNGTSPSRASLEPERAARQASISGASVVGASPNTASSLRSMEQREYNRRLARQSGGLLARQSEAEPLPASPRSVSGSIAPPGVISASTSSGGSSSKSGLLGLGGLLKRESKKNLNSPKEEKDYAGGFQHSNHDSSRKTSLDFGPGTPTSATSKGSANSSSLNLQAQGQQQQHQSSSQIVKKTSALLGRKRGKTMPSSASPPPSQATQLPPMQVAPLHEGPAPLTNGTSSLASAGWTQQSMSQDSASRRRLSQSNSAQDLSGSTRSANARNALPTITASPSAANLRTPSQDQQDSWPERQHLSPSVPASSNRSVKESGVSSKPVSPVSVTASRIPRATASSIKSHGSGSVTMSAAANATSSLRAPSDKQRGDGSMQSSTSSHRLSGSQSHKSGQSSLAANFGIGNVEDGTSSVASSESAQPMPRRQSLTLGKTPVSSTVEKIPLPPAAARLPANSSLVPILQAYKAAKTATEVEAVLRRARIASYTSALTPSEREVLNSLSARNESRVADSAAPAKERTSGSSRPSAETSKSSSGVTRIGPSSVNATPVSSTRSTAGTMDPPSSVPAPQRKSRASLSTFTSGAKAAREQALSQSASSSSSAQATKSSVPTRGARQTAVSMTSTSRPSQLSPEPSSGASISSITTNFVDEEERLGDEEMEAYIQRQHAKKIAAGAKAEELEKMLNFPEPEPPTRAYSARQAEALWGNRLSPYEFKEMHSYEEVFYVGQARTKKQATVEKAANNFGYDDERGDYLIMTHDHIAYRYEIRDLLGRGSFGQVLQCKDHKTGKFVALKLIRNKKRFHQQALVEVKILENLTKWDPDGQYHVIRMTESFYFRNHLCIAMELLSINLYELIKANNFAGFSTRLIRRFTSQVLSSLSLMKHHKVVHCDLKPENILLRHPRKSAIKVIDFGSSCFENEKVYTYIQSRFYRSPEVILGMNYHTAIDIWSLGCIIAELYTGYPLFPGENEQEQLACIMEVLGVPDRYLIDRSSRKKLFFDSSGSPRPVVNSKGKRRRPATKSLAQVLKCNDELFIDFISKCLVWDPERRIKPDPALRHPWILQGRRLAAAAAASSPTPYSTNGVYSVPQSVPRKITASSSNAAGSSSGSGSAANSGSGVSATPGRKQSSNAGLSSSASRSTILSNTHSTPARRTSVMNGGATPMRTPRSQQPVS
ncbi:hypothetical protein A4X13_0g5634 [Tilletia indica]|uniref:dual-specificity kinase n=1 Tax=Tilletia indica TaxID=43049 RepID=A0A177TSX9_9BASI|nr:hypothetical protein A4X13_0g5634 [Tilletia indica]